jgi:hypothetical protein
MFLEGDDTRLFGEDREREGIPFDELLRDLTPWPSLTLREGGA